MSDEQLIERVKLAIENAETGVSRVSKAAMSVGGFTANGNRRVLNNLAKIVDTYCEVGVLRGASFVAANCNNKLRKSYAIDTFEQDFGQPDNRSAFYQNLESIAWKDMDTDFVILEKDCFSVTHEDIKEPIQLYFFDGPHDYESQKKAVAYYKQFMEDTFIMCTDDVIWRDTVYKGTMDGIKEANLEILYQVELGRGIEGDNSENGFWNNMLITVLKKKK